MGISFFGVPVSFVLTLVYAIGVFEMMQVGA